MDVAGTSPRTVCAEAVQAILDVTQSYASLFTLRRTPCFVPYFVFAAGLTRIVLESDSSTVDSSPSASSAMGLSPGTVNTNSPSPYRRSTLDDSGDTPMTGTDSEQTSLSPGASANTRSTSANTTSTAATSVSNASEEDRSLTQAVLQLQEMSVGHPAAAQAGWVLRDLNPQQNNR